MLWNRDGGDGFTLVELLVVMVVLGILAAIAIPRFMDQRAQGYNTTALTDLRNLIVVETGLEVESGLTDQPDDIAAEGWNGSDDRIRVCADLQDDGEDIVLTAWHLDGTLQYSWRRSNSVVETNEVDLEETCVAQLGGTPETIWPHP